MSKKGRIEAPNGVPGFPTNPNCYKWWLNWYLVGGFNLPLWKKIKTVVSWDYYPQLNGKIKFMFQTTNQIPLIPCLGFQGIQRDNLFQRLPPNLTNHQHFLGGGCICSFQHNGKSRKQKKCMGMAHKWSVFRVNGGSCWCVLYWSIHFTAQ